MNATDETVVRGLYRQLMDGWNKGSGESFSAPFAEDGDLIGFDGTYLKGRREIAAFHQPLFDKWLKGTRLVGDIKSLRFLTQDVAVMHAVGGTIMPGQSKPAPERDSIQTLVAKRSDGEWRLAAFQNTRLRSMSGGLAAVLAWNFSDWLWKLVLRKR